MKLQNHLKFVLYKTIIWCMKNLSKSVCLSALLGGSHVIKDEDQLETDLRGFLQKKYPETDLEELR